MSHDLPIAFPYVTKEWELDGTPVVEFLWPKDRLILVQTNTPVFVVERGLPLEVREGDQIMVPTFDVRLAEGGVEDHLRSAIKADESESPVAHLFRVQDYPHQVAIMVAGTRCMPPMDLFEQLQRRDDLRVAVRQRPTA